MIRTSVARLLAVAALLLASTTAALPAAADSSPVVSTLAGDLRGTSEDGVDSFRGVPYAAPPVGARRWQPPQPAASWKGVRAATSYGARCPALASSNGPRSTSENCLFLNIDRPTGATGASGLPVYVFIHGGGLTNGSSNQAGGEKIARESNAIVVSMNYRLGVFGFLGLPGLSATGAGNYGFLDQQAALRWVQANIEPFGGDPDRVTIDGESAGGFSVCGHMVAAGSRGLFSQAMMHSGGCPSRSVKDTRVDSRKAVVRDAGCTRPSNAEVVACLRRLSTLKLLQAGTRFESVLTHLTETLPVALTAAVKAGDIARVPIVIGSNRDEGRTFFTNLIGGSRADYEGVVAGIFGDKSTEILAQYPWPADADRFTAPYLISDVVTDSGVFNAIGGCGTLGVADAFGKTVPTHLFEFDAREGPGLTPIPGYVWGAGHAAELAYFFPSFDNGPSIVARFDAGERQLSRDLIRYWGSFVFTGDPGGTGSARWTRYDETGDLISFRPAGQSVSQSAAAYRVEHRCDFWGTGYSGF